MAVEEEEEGEAERRDGVSTERNDEHGGAAIVPSVDADSDGGASRTGGVFPVVASERAGREEEIEAEAEAAAAEWGVEVRDADAEEVKRVDGDTPIPPSFPPSGRDHGDRVELRCMVGFRGTKSEPSLEMNPILFFDEHIV